MTFARPALRRFRSESASAISRNDPRLGSSNEWWIVVNIYLVVILLLYVAATAVPA